MSAAEQLKDLGNAQRSAGNLAQAIESYRRSLEADPTYLASLYNLGLALHEAGELAEAETCFRRLLALEPRDVEALFHLGVLQQSARRYAEAAITLRRALLHAPNDAQLWLRLGVVQIALGTGEALREAELCFVRAIELRPDLGEAHYNLGCARDAAGRRPEALASFRRALELRPGDPVCQANVLAQMQQICDWTGFDELCAVRRAAVRVPVGEDTPPDPFGMLSIPSTPEEQLAGARAYSQWVERHARDGSAAQPSHNPVRGAGNERSRLRVGYLSADFHEHVTAHVMIEVFEHHDRGRIETIAYSYGLDDGSPIRARLKGAFGRFVDLLGLTDEQSAAAIRADGLDILVDLKGYTRGARPGIAARRPAPLQASYLGFPATMGAAFIDYVITDRYVLPPEGAQYFSEKPAYLPGSYYPSSRSRVIPSPPPRAELGLPADGFVFCCFNQPYKILPAIFDTWMRLLTAVPGSVLWLLETNRWMRENLRREAERRKVDPQRLVFASTTGPELYLRRLAAADLFLDTAPYNAHTTASDALWVGLPVLTCPGTTLPSRVAASQLSALGLNELIADSLASYEAIASRLARAPTELRALRERIAGMRDTAALFDPKQYARNLENLFEEMSRAGGGDAVRPVSA